MLSISPTTSPYGSPRRRSRSISRPPRILEHIPSHSHSDSSHISSDFRTGSNGRSRSTDSGAESDTESDLELQASRSNGSSVTLNMSPFEALKARLQPLRHIERLLVAKLVPPNEEEATRLPGPSHSHSIYPPGQSQNYTAVNSFRNQEVFVRPGMGWRGALARNRVNNPSVSDDVHENGRPYSAGNTGLETADEPQEVLHACQQDLILLWNDGVVREILRRKKVRLEEFPGLYVTLFSCLTDIFIFLFN